MTVHLAIPAKDLEKSLGYYVNLGATVVRKYDTNVVLRLFSALQLVLHQSDKIDEKPEMYPRHFGFVIGANTFNKLFLKFHDRLHFPLQTRYAGKPGEHQTFFLCDPSNNLIEFKAYKRKSEI